MFEGAVIGGLLFIMLYGFLIYEKLKDISMDFYGLNLQIDSLNKNKKDEKIND